MAPNDTACAFYLFATQMLPSPGQSVNWLSRIQIRQNLP